MGSYGLGFIVYSEDEGLAKEAANNLLKDLCGKKRAFEYGGTGAAFRADSPKGKEAIDKIFGWMIRGFQADLEKVRKALRDHSDDEILSDECRASEGIHDSCTLPLLRYHMHCLGMYTGPSVRLYDTDGNGIRTRKELDEALQHETSRVFVVTADAHS